MTYKIEGSGIEHLARLTAELTKQGVCFNAILNEGPREGWIVTLTGGF